MFVKVGTVWHKSDHTYIQDAMTYRVETACGIDAPWDQTFVDSLPGGGEEVHEGCGDSVKVAAEIAPKKKTTKKK